MRLDGLEVNGFGTLDEFEASFHHRLTVILGENESGKSTVHRALRAALYGLDAGGPGRPTERSEWARWTPWHGGAYSLALTYSLGDGRRLRVARRLEQREHACQVQEIGRGDVTDQLRVGRAVVPGQVHLGIDEAVFCASACVSDEGLRLGGADTPAARAAQVQEAIERLADSGASTTATEALAALAEAARRVGSERRLTSPLGHAVNRLRQLDVQIDDARGRLLALAAEEQRLRGLEAESAAAEEREAGALRRWLVGRLAGLAAQREHAEAAAAEMVHLAAEIEGNDHLARFPLELEDRVVELAAEFQEAQRSAAEARARMEASREPLAVLRRRRGEIAAGLAALTEPVVLDPESRAEARELAGELATVVAGGRRREDLATATSRRDALRREVAATGLSAVPAASLDEAAGLVDAARSGPGRRFARWAASLALVAGTVVATVAAASGHRPVAMGAAAAALLATVLALATDRALSGDSARAHRRLGALLGGGTIDGEALERLAERLPRLRALHHELQREEIRIEALALDVLDGDRRMKQTALRADTLARRAGVQGSGDEAGAEERVREVLAAVATVDGIRERRRELEAEDALLAEREGGLRQVADEAAGRASAASAVEARLRRILTHAGVDPAIPVREATAAFRQACAGRARHGAAVRRMEEVRRHAALAGDRRSVDRTRDELERQLRARGGDPAEAVSTVALSHGELQELEAEAGHARQSAVVAATAAAALRARLTEMRSGQPPLADLEDDRATCVAARDRARRQLAGLQRAAELIESSTRGVHAQLAPRLADSVAGRLATLTDGRYTAANVDTAHFEVALLGRDRLDLVGLELVSHGTRDQVSLLLRLALAEVLSGNGEAVPLLLDEPLLSADPQRRRTALEFLWKLSATNQVILSTSDPGVVAELRECCEGDGPGVIEMLAPGGSLETVGRRAVAAARRL